MTSDEIHPALPPDGAHNDGNMSAADPDQRVQQLAAEIDDTRGDLTQTIQAIGEKLEPGTIAREATESVKAATLGKVEQMGYGAQETWRDVRTGNTGSIVDNVRSNPVPAVMVGAGLALLFLSRGKQAQDRSVDRGRSWDGYRSFRGGYDIPGGERYARGGPDWGQSGWERRSANGGSNPLEQAGSAVAGAAGSAGEAMGRAADQAGQTVGRFADSVGQSAGDLPRQAGELMDRRTADLRGLIDDNPLGVGVIAVAAGAALGMLLPSTDIERQTMGEARDDLVEQAESQVHQALDSVDEQMEARQPSHA
jgi:hypothetical protein